MIQIYAIVCQQGIITTFSIDPLCINATYEGTPPFIH